MFPFYSGSNWLTRLQYQEREAEEVNIAPSWLFDTCHATRHHMTPRRVVIWVGGHGEQPVPTLSSLCTPSFRREYNPSAACEQISRPKQE